jgi:hypothetical protein
MPPGLVYPSGSSYYAAQYFTWGYWHYAYNWVWGTNAVEAAAGKAPNPYDCSTQTPMNATSDTNMAGAKRYAGPLHNPGSYGRTNFVYGYGAGTPDPSQPGNDTLYDPNVYTGPNANQSLWQGMQYQDSGATYGSDTTTGFTSWRCTVLRHGGWVTSGAWQAGSAADLAALGVSTQTPAGDVWAGAGWGVNNTGHRVANGQYEIQFTFSNLTQSALTQPTGYCASHTTQAFQAIQSVPGLCWRMSGSYDGRLDYSWAHVVRENNPNSPESSARVSVFEPRNAR